MRRMNARHVTARSRLRTEDAAMLDAAIRTNLKDEGA